MTRLLPVPLLAAVLLALPEAPAVPMNDPSADLFKPVGPVPVVKVNVDDLNLQLLRKDDRKAVRCNLIVDGQTFPDVAMHAKGSVGSRRGWDDKPGLTLNMDKFVSGQTFRGLDKFHLNNGAQDGSFFNEILANELALSMGVPACRCTHAMVELNGRKVGLYVLKEGFDKTWMKRHFADAGGNLYDGGFCRDIDQDLKLDSGTDNGRKDLKALVKACQEGDANKRYAAVEKLVDVDKFVAFAAQQIITCDWDGYVRKPNNYRVYFDPKSGKAVFVPHGMDQMWQNPGEGIWNGWGGMVARAILDHPEGKKKVLAKLADVLKNQFTIEKMHKRIDELYPRVKEAIVRVNKDWAGGYENEVKNIKERIRQRIEYLNKELPKVK